MVAIPSVTKYVHVTDRYLEERKKKLKRRKRGEGDLDEVPQVVEFHDLKGKVYCLP